MSETQLRSYRLTSLEEPTDEMLHAIMEKVAVAARKSTARAEEAKRRMLAETARRIKQNELSHYEHRTLAAGCHRAVWGGGVVIT